MSFFNNVKEFIKKYWFIIIIAIISFIRIHMVNKLPMIALPKEGSDDGLMVSLAKNIIEGKWLGTFESNTLVKGAGYPIFLALVKSLNLSYLFTINVLYVLACIYFIYAIKDDIKSKILKLIIFVVMIFNPISYAELSFQRIYRNFNTVFQAIFIFSAMYIIWKNKTKGLKSMIWHILIAAFNMVFLWHSKEDSIWILPFMIVISALILIVAIFNHFSKNKKGERKELESNKRIFAHAAFVFKLVMIAMPIWVLVFSTATIKSLNEKYYGVYIEKDSEVGNVCTALYSVKAKENYPRVDNPREEIYRVYEVSETLNSIRDSLEYSLDNWAIYGSDPEKKQVENGWFGWAIKSAMTLSGNYDDPKSLKEFCDKICDEIYAALDSGELEREENILISGQPPFRDEYKDQFMSYWLGYVQFMYEFRTMQSSNNVSEDYISLDSVSLNDFEFVTNDEVATRSVSNARICGWYALQNRENYTMYLTNEKDVKIKEITRSNSEDLISIFSLDPRYNYRFDYVINDIESIADYEKLYLSVFDMDKKLVDKIDLFEPFPPRETVSNDVSIYSLHLVSINKKVDPVITYSDKAVETLNSIKDIYAKYGKALYIVSLSVYVLLIVKFVIKLLVRKNVTKDFDVLMMLSAYMLSTIVVIIGVAYTGITSCYTLLYFYLAAIYPLFIMFATHGIGYLVDGILEFLKNNFIKKEKAQD